MCVKLCTFFNTFFGRVPTGRAVRFIFCARAAKGYRCHRSRETDVGKTTTFLLKFG